MSVANGLFGAYLHVRLNEVRGQARKGPYYEALKALTVKPEAANRLEDGNWSTVRHDDLLRLEVIGKHFGVAPLIQVRTNPVWETFAVSKHCTVIAGVDESGEVFECDQAAASNLRQSGLGAKFIHKRTYAKRDIEAAMTKHNLLVLGTAVHNEATGHVFSAVFGESPRVRFFHPKAPQGRPSVLPSPSGARGMSIDNAAAVFEESGRQLGVIVVVKNPMGALNVTTLVVAGCSLKTSDAMVHEMQTPQFHHLCGTREAWIAGIPQLVLYDSGSARKWSVLGHPRQMGAREPGKPPMLGRLGRRV